MTRKVGNGLDLGNQRLSNLGAATTDSDALNRGTANGLYAAIGANARMLLASTPDVLPLQPGYRMTPRTGFPVGFATPIYSFMMALTLPAAGAQTWALKAISSSGVITTVATVTIASGAVGGVTNLGGSFYSLAATDTLDIVCTSNAGTISNPGVGPAARVSFQNLTLALPTAPATPTGVSAVAGSGLNTINFVLPATATDAVIWKNGQAYTTAVGTSWVDTAGLSTDNYAVSSANLGSISAVSSTVTPAVSSFAYWASGVRNLSADTTDWIVTLGSASGTAVTVDGAGKVTWTSGATGSNNANDINRAQWKGPDGASGPITACRIKELIDTTTSGVVWEYYLRGATPIATSAKYIQIQVNTSGVRIGGKTGGSFLNWTITGAANVTCAQATAGGTVPFTSSALAGALNANGTTQYTIEIEVLPVSVADGSQTIKFYLDTAANYASPALFVTVVLNSTITGALPAAGTAQVIWDDILGLQSATASAANLRRQTRAMTPLVTVGN